MEEFIAGYIDEARDMLSQVEKDLLLLEQDPKNRNIINNVFRVMHTLKGFARMYGFDNMEELAHEFETVYDYIREGGIEVSSEVIDITLRGKDMLANMLNTDFPAGSEMELVRGLKKILSPVITSEEVEKSPLDRKYYLIVFSPDTEVLKNGLDPEKMLEELNEAAGITNSIIHERDITWEEQKAKNICTTSWEIYIHTELSKDELQDLFLFYDEDEYTIIEIEEHPDIIDPDILEFFNSSYGTSLNVKEHIQVKFQELFNRVVASIPGIKEAQNVRLTENAEIIQNEIKQKSDNNSSINVSSRKIDELMNLVSELVSSTAELGAQSERFEDFKLKNAIEGIEKLTKKFRNNALELRLVPIGTLLNKFNRHVRDLSRELHKEVSLVVEGQETEIDKTILKSIENPLIHILRNCIDHGIESKEGRIELGKSEKGELKFTAFYSGANVILKIQDDGRGIDLEKVYQRAVKKGFIHEGQKVSDQDLLGFIMEPGFSTLEGISRVSGRGIGMDVVKKELSVVGGNLEIETEKNKGTSFVMKLPATLSIIDTLMIEVDHSQILLPLLEIEYCYKEYKNKLYDKDNNYIHYKNDLIPYISLRKKFNYQEHHNEDDMVIIINKDDKKYGIIVDRILGEHQAVIKPLGNIFTNQPYFSGGSVMVNGKLALILDTNYLFNQVVLD
jgi:two-component system chemotaxis sensor kinase CheA